ncbi:MAG TPA: aldose epimerase family protein [Opitutaceae bacterium]|nr:aldose epimerase family protein [Opitutaceae bacterium]
MKPRFAILAASSLLLTMSKLAASDLTTAVYGTMTDGREVKIFTLTNTQGLTARVTEYGAILVGLEVPDKAGHKADVTLGYDTLAGWLGSTSYFGATVGRFGNRIAHGQFTLDGKTYTLATNDHPGGIPCHLHGGVKGFDKVLWHGEPVRKAGARGVAFTYTSKDGEEGYPGTLHVTVTYWLTDANELVWAAEATTDKATVINLAHHTYWNLTGDPTKAITDHELMLAADSYLPTDKGLIPTGVLAPVAGTPMDFRTSTPVGARINADFEALKLGGGYDHCWVLRPGQGVRLAAVLKDPASGRIMEVLTDQPGIQFYSGNFLNGSAVGKGGVKYQLRTGLCLETEDFPDAPNRADFPSAVLRPGQTYHHTMICRFTP